MYDYDVLQETEYDSVLKLHLKVLLKKYFRSPSWPIDKSGNKVWLKPSI